MASRYDERSVVVQTLYECDFRNHFDYENIQCVLRRNFNEELGITKSENTFAENLAVGILEKRETIDAILKKSAPDWPLEKIDIVNRNILRLGIYELLFGEASGTPAKVAINEAIEMAKAFGGETSARFVNGVLGNIYKDMQLAGGEGVVKKEGE